MAVSVRNQIKGTVTRITRAEAIANVEVDATAGWPRPAAAADGV